MNLNYKLKPYTIEALQNLDGSGTLFEVRNETIKILIREGKEFYISKCGKNLYEQRWTLHGLKEEGIVENGDGKWSLKKVINLFDLVA